MALGDSRYALGLSSPVNPIVASRSSPKPYACLYASANKFPDVPREGRFSNPLISQPPHLPTVRMTLRTPLRWGGLAAREVSVVALWNLPWADGIYCGPIITLLSSQYYCGNNIQFRSMLQCVALRWDLLPNGTYCGPLGPCVAISCLSCSCSLQGAKATWRPPFSHLVSCSSL